MKLKFLLLFKEGILSEFAIMFHNDDHYLAEKLLSLTHLIAEPSVSCKLLGQLTILRGSSPNNNNVDWVSGEPFRNPTVKVWPNRFCLNPYVALSLPEFVIPLSSLYWLYIDFQNFFLQYQLIDQLIKFNNKWMHNLVLALIYRKSRGKMYFHEKLYIFFFFFFFWNLCTVPSESGYVVTSQIFSREGGIQEIHYIQL